MENTQFQEWVVQLAKIFSDIGVGLAGFIAAYIGIKGYSAWRRELVGRGRYEAAQEAVEKAFVFRYEFHETRKFVLVPSEWVDREKEPGETPEVTRIRNTQYAVQQRSNGLLKARYELQTACWRAEAKLKEKPGTLFKDFSEIFLSYTGSFFFFFNFEYTKAVGGFDGGPSDDDKRKYVTSRNVLYGIEEDETGRAINAAVERLQQRLSTYLD